jgi:hypothetical protein
MSNIIEDSVSPLKGPYKSKEQTVGKVWAVFAKCTKVIVRFD